MKPKGCGKCRTYGKINILPQVLGKLFQSLPHFPQSLLLLFLILKK